MKWHLKIYLGSQNPPWDNSNPNLYNIYVLMLKLNEKEHQGCTTLSLADMTTKDGLKMTKNSWLHISSRDDIYFPSPWIWAGLLICFNQWNIEEGMLWNIWPGSLKIGNSFIDYLLLGASHHVRKSDFLDTTMLWVFLSQLLGEREEHMEVNWGTRCKSEEFLHF